MKATIYSSYVQWPISWSRLQGGWLIHFFAWTIIVEKTAAPPLADKDQKI